MEAAVLRCPGCGAPAAGDETGCRHCGSRLAAVACPSCFAMMFAGSRHCPHCGTRGERTGAALSSSLPCPRCRAPMEGARVGTAPVRECGSCGGLWLDSDTFERVCAEREEQAAVLAFAPSRPAPPAAAEAVRYLPCPACGELMGRINFQRISGVVVDSCRHHGTWCDRDELRRIVEFIRAGGVQAARERERMRLEEEHRRLDRKRAELTAGLRPAPGYDDDRETLADLMLRGVLRWLKL